MKKIIYTVLMALIVVGCKQSEIQPFNDIARIDFPYNNNCRFNDDDYLAKLTGKVTVIEHILPIQVRLVGDFLTTPRTFVVKQYVSPQDKLPVTLRTESKYTFAANEPTVMADVVIACPAKYDLVYPAHLEFDNKNSNHQFGVGRVEKRYCNIDVVYVIKPASWNIMDFGLYSNSKYEFMMNHWRKKLSQIMEMTGTLAEKQKEIREAYAQYRKTNPPLYDDEKDRQEIVFP